MPRKSRIDAAGALHHIIAPGIDRGKIFQDPTDKRNLLARLGEILKSTETNCFAWVLIPNHFHLMLKTGDVPVAMVMRRLLTGHALKVSNVIGQTGSWRSACQSYLTD